MNRAMYAGSFDPPTYGHLDIMLDTLCLFEELVVVIATNSAKAPLFSFQERVKFLETHLLTRIHDPSRVSFVHLKHGLTVQAAKDYGCQVMIRGIRGVSDLDYELQIASANRQLVPHIPTLFLPASQKHLFTSSSMVKEIAKNGGDVLRYVSEDIAKAIITKIGSQEPKFHRTLVQIKDVRWSEGMVSLAIPTWHPEPFDCPINFIDNGRVRESLKAGEYVMAYANLSADTPTRLKLRRFEIAPPLDDNDGLA